MVKRKIFMSYDYSEDVNYKHQFQAWNANSVFDFEFDSDGPDVRIDSDNAPVVMVALTRCMKTALTFLSSSARGATRASGWPGNLNLPRCPT